MKKNFIKESREKLGLSQKELSELLFCERSTVSMWESGKRNPKKITIREVLRLVEAHESKEGK